MIGLIVFPLLSVLLLYTSIHLFSERPIYLAAYSSITDTVHNSGIIDNPRGKGKRFIFVFEGSLMFNPSYYYYDHPSTSDRIAQKIKTGDLVTVYYKNKPADKRVIQLERKGEIIISKTEAEKSGKILAWVALLGCFILAGVTYLQYRSYKRARESQATNNVA